MISSKRSLLALLAMSLYGASFAFTVPRQTMISTTRGRQVQPLFEATGGWGIGQSRDITPEEFAKGDRRAFEGYELKDKSDFMRNVKQEQDSMKKQELNELLGVAKIAGINVKDPKERLNKFEPDLLDDDEGLDLSV